MIVARGRYYVPASDNHHRTFLFTIRLENIYNLGLSFLNGVCYNVKDNDLIISCGHFAEKLANLLLTIHAVGRL